MLAGSGARRRRRVRQPFYPRPVVRDGGPVASAGHDLGNGQPERARCLSGGELPDEPAKDPGGHGIRAHQPQAGDPGQGHDDRGMGHEGSLASAVRHPGDPGAHRAQAEA